LVWGVQAEAQAGGRAEQRVDALEQTRALADTLAGDKEGRFAQSKFLQFISKMSRGEIILEGNEVRARARFLIRQLLAHMPALFTRMGKSRD
jgi:peroxin-5